MSGSHCISIGKQGAPIIPFRGATLWGIAKRLKIKGCRTTQEKVKVLLKANPHIKNPKKIVAGKTKIKVPKSGQYCVSTSHLRFKPIISTHTRIIIGRIVPPITLKSLGITQTTKEIKGQQIK